ncbi:MAG: acetyl-CoA carboxylase biotin carboxyl carrier protein [Phycisphaeraceae bacterium]|nr:acetyl-CoA carboxylase biotin carboxyl carrier protein [Phycisphaeraceae bacterium]
MIDTRKLKELVRLMVENDLVEIDLRDEQEQVTLKRPTAMAMPVVSHQPMAMAPVAPPPPPSAGAAAPAAPASDPNAGLVPIESPMVGTFYQAPGPDKPPFVAVGASIGPESVVCLVEAMKIFNEIKAGVSGTVERILVRSGDAVEFGQPLFMVRPG